MSSFTSTTAQLTFRAPKFAQPATGYSVRSFPKHAANSHGHGDKKGRRDLTRRMGDDPHGNLWSRPPFRYNIEYPWTKWNIAAFQPFAWKMKPPAAHCPQQWISSGLAEKLLFMPAPAVFAFLLDTLRPIVARALEGQGYMFASEAEYDSFHFGEDPDLKRRIIGDAEDFMQIRLPPWAYAPTKTVLDLVHWFTRRVTIARPFFQYDIPDGWSDVINDYKDVMDHRVYSMWREHIRNVSDPFYQTSRKVHSADPSDWEASHIRYDQIMRSENRHRKAATLGAPARPRDFNLYNWKRYSGLPARPIRPKMSGPLPMGNLDVRQAPTDAFSRIGISSR